MPHGPGKYDNIATMVRNATDAEAVVLCVFGGSLGTGVSVKCEGRYLPHLPGVLQEIARRLEKDGAPPEGSGLELDAPLEPPPIIFKVGDGVRIGYGGRVVDGKIALAAANGRALGLEFEAILGGFAGAMPVGWDGAAFRDILFAKVVTIERAP
jgi:hypothetical protein